MAISTYTYIYIYVQLDIYIYIYIYIFIFTHAYVHVWGYVYAGDYLSPIYGLDVRRSNVQSRRSARSTSCMQLAGL